MTCGSWCGHVICRSAIFNRSQIAIDYSHRIVFDYTLNLNDNTCSFFILKLVIANSYVQRLSSNSVDRRLLGWSKRAVYEKGSQGIHWNYHLGCQLNVGKVCRIPCAIPTDLIPAQKEGHNVCVFVCMKLNDLNGVRGQASLPHLFLNCLSPFAFSASLALVLRITIIDSRRASVTSNV